MKRLTLLLCICGFILNANASHIVGGEIMYEYAGNSGNFKNYVVTLYLYIDCINGQPDAISQDRTGFFNVFNSNTEALLTSYCKTVTRTGPTRVSDVNYTCIKNKPNACVDKYTYTTNITIPANGKYIVSFERCCRNNTIFNIVTPSSTGATYWTEINTSTDNSSPYFKGLPPNFLCTNAPLYFDHSALDSDGDSLVYELYQPYTGAGQGNPRPAYDGSSGLPHFPGDLVIWASGFDTYNNQISGNPTLSIDRKTGRLNLTPTQTGQFVIGLKVKEYRNGILIGETKRDFQFNVSECQFYVVSSFFVPKFNCTGNELNFTNRSQGGLTYLWDFGDPINTNDTSILKDPQYTYSMPGNYQVKLITTNNSCSDTSYYDINVKQNFVVKLNNDTLICGPFTKTLTSNIVGKQYKWNTGEISPSITVNIGGKYWLAVTDDPCISRDTINIINDLSVIDLGPDSVICRDSFVQFTYEGKPGYKTYLWNDSTKEQPVFISQLGRYWVYATNENNCPSLDSITFILYPPPRVNLNDSLFCKGTSVELDGVNYSFKTKLETQYKWNTGETTPQITTYTPGTYIVKVRNRLCTIFDTAVIAHIETGLELGQDTFFCGPVYRWIYPQKGFVKYVWFDNAETIDYLALTPGKKKLTITSKEGCVESDSITLYQYPQIDGGLGNDTTICLSSQIELKAADSMTSYLWNTGQTTQSISVRDQGLYIIRVSNENGCIVYDSIRIKEQADALPIDLFMPNAFTPNDDNLNETYPGNHYADPGSPFQLRLYNRWGEKIFESNSPTYEWDGKIKGEYAPQDIYVYYVKYVGCDEVERWFRGTFTLLR